MEPNAKVAAAERMRNFVEFAANIGIRPRDTITIKAESLSGEATMEFSFEVFRHLVNME